jgi:hypothetical protein
MLVSEVLLTAAKRFYSGQHLDRRSGLLNWVEVLMVRLRP